MNRFIKSLYPLLIILLAIFLLRLPSFFEPYYDGDEGIYYTIGWMLRKGAVLYRDIWDNKPPLLYFLYALLPNLFLIKLAATTATIGTCLAIFKITRRLLPTALAGILLSIPIFEGNTANAEIFFVLPIAISAYLLFISKFTKITPFIIGILFTISFLIKVPAIFDFVGLFAAFSIIKFIAKENLKKFLISQIKFYILIFSPFIISIIALVFYFQINHALPDFLTAVFSQNAAYVAVDTGPLSKLTNPLFVKGFILLLSLITLFILFLKKRVPKELFFLSLWFAFSLFGTLLSGRSYPHYLLQIIPPLIILLFYLLSNIKANLISIFLLATVIFFIGKSFTGNIPNLNELLTSGKAFAYYQNFFDFISERKTWEEYANTNFWALEHYQIASYLKSKLEPRTLPRRQAGHPLAPIFVWGENAYLYFLSGHPPITKFIRAHHLTTIPKENYQKTINRLQKFQPQYILVARPVQFNFPELETFIAKGYRLEEKINSFYIYKSTQLATPTKWTPNYSLN